MMNKHPTEAAEGRALMKWASFHPVCRDYLIHIPNGGSRSSAKEGANLKAQGVKAGVSDYFLAYPCGKRHGMWIELKRCGKSNVSLAQSAWIELMKSNGYEAGVCWGWEEARVVIENYLELKFYLDLNKNGE